MKKLLLLLSPILLFTSYAAAQPQLRQFDNFDTNRGVQVAASEPQRARIVADVPTDKRTAKAQARHYLPSPPYGDEYKDRVDTGPITKQFIQPTAQVTMRVNDGFVQRADFRSAEATRLTMGHGSQMKGYSTGDDLIDAYIVDSSRRYRIDPLLIYAQMGQESSFKLRALSNKGASGLMQLMPATARRLGVTNIYDPKQNIEGGVKYMRILLDMFDQDVNLALAGYNAGEGAVIKYGYQIPPYNETQDYVRRISARYKAISNANLALNRR